MAERNQAGMTLLELVVALTVIGLIMVTLTETLRFGVSATAIVDSQTEKLSELRSLHTFLRRQIETARTTYWRRDSIRIVAFDGTENSLAFVAIGKRGPTSGGLFRLRLAIEQQSLLLSSRPLAGAEPGFDFATGTEHIPLSSSVARLRLAYLGRKLGARKTDWHRDWRAQVALPQLVRIKLDFKDDRASPALDIAFALGPQPR